MNTVIRKNALFAAVACPMLFVAQGASADLITEWDYTVDSGFSSFSATDGEGGVTQSETDDQDVLSWGVGGDGDQSSVSVERSVENPPPLVTNGDSVPGATFTHDNNVISDDSASLDEFTLRTQLDLTSTEPESEAGQDQSLPAITFNSFFTETDNVDGAGDSDTCLATSVSQCDDIFVLTNAEDLDAIGGGESFDIDGITYTVSLGIEDLRTLTADECDLAGAATGCIGFTTQENQDNAFNTNFSITAEQPEEVPEPGTLALLGVGLAGLGFATRARKS